MSIKKLWILVGLMLVLGLVIGLMTPVSQNGHARATAQVAPVDDAWRAALPRDAAAATAAYMARLSPAAVARSNAYFEGGYWLQVISLGVTIASCWAVLASRILVGTRGDFAGSRRRGWLRALAVTMLFGLLTGVLSFPLLVYQDFYREHLYGMANRDFNTWLGEASLNAVIGIVLSSLLFTVIYAVIRRVPRRWWIWGTGITVTFAAIMLLLAPVYIDPLFNTYKPLDDRTIKEPILAMARADGVPVDNVYQFDASRQTDRISANVSGIFGVAAVRLNDNLLKKTSLPEIKGVMGHEIGHYVLNHMYKMLIALVLILGLGFAFLKWSLGAALRRWGERYGLRGESDPANLPLLMVLFSLYIFIMTPVFNTVTRVDEAEADAYGLNASQEPDGFAEVDLKLTEYRKPDPGPLEEFFFYDHPSPRKRIFAAMRWKQEHWKEAERKPSDGPLAATPAPPTTGGVQSP